MATVLDLGLIDGLSPIFSFILVFAVVYGLLNYNKVFGENKLIHSTIAFVFAVMMLFAPKALDVIKIMTPWFVIMMIAGLFILMVYKLFGTPDESISWAVRNYGGLKYGLVAVSIIIIVASFGQVYFSSDGNNNSSLVDSYEGDVGGVGEEALMATLFHPKVLGMLVIMLIAVFTISLLSSQPGRR